MSLRDHRSLLPGFNLTLGFTLFYLSGVVLIPLAGLFFVTAEMTWSDFARAAFAPQVIHAYKVSLGASLAAALVNTVFGLIVAWVLVRYSFPGKRVLDAMVDLPFALPTAVAGIALAAIYAPNGWIGKWAQPIYSDLINLLSEKLTFVPWTCFLGERLAYDLPGVFIALTFIGLPFIVRTVQPVLAELEPELEEAAASLGATRVQTLRHVVVPVLLPALLAGFALAFARALGEYGSVVFIAGNMPFRSEIVPVLIVAQLEKFNYAGAAAIGTVMLLVSFSLLLAIHLLQRRARRYQDI